MEPLEALAGWRVAAALRHSETLYIAVNAGHILAIGLLVGAIVTLDLRLLGLFGRYALAHLGPPLRRIAATGLALAAITGFLLFSTRPAAYAENPAFLAKLALIALGMLNVVALHAGRAWSAALAGDRVPRRLRLAAVLSLATWVPAVLAGRWIGFLQ